MQTTTLRQLSDVDLECAVKRLAVSARRATAELVAHLAEFERRGLHLAAGFKSLFLYSRSVLRLSESEAYNRIEAARAAQAFPVLLDRLRDGALNLTTVRLIAPQLTSTNAQTLIAEACGKSKREVEDIVARLAPREDVPASIRKLPTPPAQNTSSSAAVRHQNAGSALDSAPVPSGVAQEAVAPASPNSAPAVAATLPARPPTAATRPLVAPLAPDRYQVRFTARATTCEKLRMAQDLLRHAIPDGDPDRIIDRALTLLLEDLARKKAAVTTRPERRREVLAPRERTVMIKRTRHIPAKVRRAVWLRDGGRCAFTSKSERRCNERGLVEFHHVDPHGVGGEASVSNIELRCRAHNQYEAVLFYGPGALGRARPLVPERVASTVT